MTSSLNNIFNIDLTTETIDDDVNELPHINIDDLYEKHEKRYYEQLNLYNKILKRIYSRIQWMSKRSKGSVFFFAVPPIIFGTSYYDPASCVGYLMEMMSKDHFNVTFTHPNILEISWAHWIPRYVRNYIFQKFNLNIDAYGNIIHEEQENEINNQITTNEYNTTNNNNNKKTYKPIQSYKPTGKLLYEDDIFKSIEQRIHK